MSIFTKSLFVPSTVALGLLAVIGSAQAQQNNPSAAGSASRKIEVISGKQVALAAQPDADVNAESESRPANAVADASQTGVDPVDANAQSDTAPSISGPAPQRADNTFIVSEEAKRLNRQRYIERYEAAQQYEEQRYSQQYAEPRYEERYIEPRYVQPRYAEHRYVAPRYYAPREVYVQRYHVAPSYGRVHRTAEHRSHRGYGY
jgi:hypothetical protein